MTRIVRTTEEIRSLLQWAAEERRDDVRQTLLWLFGSFSPAHPGHHADDEAANEFVHRHDAFAEANIAAAMEL